MTDRDRLIKLVRKGIQEFGKSTVKCSVDEYIADYLIANGVILPPCKVGTYVYFITDVNGQCFTVRFGRVYEISIVSNDNLFLSVAEYDESDNVVDQWDIPKSQWGKTVFLTREEAEKALERSKGNA